MALFQLLQHVELLVDVLDLHLVPLSLLVVLVCAEGDELLALLALLDEVVHLLLQELALELG